MIKILKKIKTIFKNRRNSKKIEKYKQINKKRNYQQSVQKKQINIVFVCHRPACWNYQKSIFEECIKDPDFNITIVAIPNKKQLPTLGLGHEIYETEGAEEFFKDFPCKVINGYNYKTKEWLDLKDLNPNYVFFQTPYNVCRPTIYHSKRVNEFSRICYIHYGLSMLKDQSVPKEFAKDFFQYTSLIFAETKFHKQSYREEIVKHNKKYNFNNIFLTGCPAFDNLSNYKQSESDLWKHKNSFRIIWTPRWTTTENNCNFQEYKDLLFAYAENTQSDFIFRPHPQAFLNYVAEGIMTEEDLINMQQKYKESAYCSLDRNKGYLKTLYSSDVLISDASGITFEYLLTQKPLIYTRKSDEWANDFSKRTMIDAAYVVHNWQELEQTLNMLKSGNDPLEEKRQEIIKSEFYIPEQGAGYTIKELIKKDFKGVN